MTPDFESVRADIAKARLKLISIANAVAVAIGSSILALNLMYPNAVGDLSAHLPPLQKFIVLVVFSSLVQWLIHRTKKSI